VGRPWLESVHVDSWWQLHHLQRELNKLGRLSGLLEDEREKQNIETKGKETDLIHFPAFSGLVFLFHYCLFLRKKENAKNVAATEIDAICSKLHIFLIFCCKRIEIEMSPQSNYGSGEASEDVKHPPISKPQSGLVKTEVSFGEDLINFAEGTVPQSIIVALVIGTFKASSI